MQVQVTLSKITTTTKTKTKPFRGITPPVGQVRRSSKYRGSCRVESGRVGSGRVGPGRVGSSRVRNLQNLKGRVGSGQEVFKSRGPG